MSDFSVGYAQVNINPMLGLDISGYYVPRFAKGSGFLHSALLQSK